MRYCLEKFLRAAANARDWLHAKARSINRELFIASGRPKGREILLPMRRTMQDLRIDALQRGESVTILINGRKTTCCRGESVHAVLLAAGHRQLRNSKTGGGARGVFCGMGVCYECMVTINGVSNQRACMIDVEDGMEILTHES
jgi:sarcosine oxidase subunit alpha